MFFSRYQAEPGNEYLEALPPFEVRKSVFYGVGLERNYPRSNFTKSSSGTWRTMENKIFGAKQAQAFRF